MKKTIIITIAILFVLSGVVLASDMAESVKREESVPVEEVAEQQATEISELKPEQNSVETLVVKNEFTDYLKSCGDEYLVNGILERAYKLSSEHNPSNSDLAYITGLVKEGYDAQWVMELYDFWTTCDDEISIIKEMYDASEQENLIGRYWEEDSYNFVTDCSHGILTPGDVIRYMDMGITEEQIRNANIYSRQKDITIHEILDKVAEGETVEKFAPQKSLTATASVSAEKAEAFKLSSEEISRIETNNQSIRSEIIKNIGEERLGKLGKYTETYVYNACVYAKENNTTPEKILEENYGTGCYSKILEKAVYIG